MICQDDQRRDRVRAHRHADGRRDLNGLDYVEVDDDQTTLTAYFIGKLPPQLRVDKPALVQHLRVEGGRRVRDIRVIDVDPVITSDKELDDYVIVYVDKPGDFSTYTLRLVDLPGIDPRYDHVEFSFKVNCPSDLDCALPANCPPPALNEPDVNYLAKDYASFRQLMLDRLALIMPAWQERHVPDLGIALVEVLAYVGDHLSYYQDAVATEAYLDTARQRISVRRHARLVDYRLHEGCNARAWVHVKTDQDFDVKYDDVYFITALSEIDTVTGRAITTADLHGLTASTYDVNEPLVTDRAQLFPARVAHNDIHFYTWGERECCLRRGTNSASLRDHWIYQADQPPVKGRDYAAAQQPLGPSIDPAKLRRTLDLHVGDVLIFEEVIGPKTGQPADADLQHRCAVRLTKVTLNEDPVITVPVAVGDVKLPWTTPVVDIEWSAEDALPFALCLSAIVPALDCQYVDNISVAHGNVVLVDHGRTLQPPEPIGQVPLKTTDIVCECVDEPGDIRLLADRFEPRLSKAPLTFSQPALFDETSATRMVLQDARAALPNIYLLSIPGAFDGRQAIFEWADLTDASNLARNILAASWTPTGWSPVTYQRGIRLSLDTQRLLAKAKRVDDVSDELVAALTADLQAMLECWVPRLDLLGSGPDDRHFVVEIDNEGVAHLRFGNDEFGQQPAPGTAFFAIYRTGNGPAGNVGADAIAHLVSRSTLSDPTIRARNPLPATGGVAPEPLAAAKLFAPSLFRHDLQRAIIAADYAEIAQREFSQQLQRTAAQLAWTGSWYEAEVAIDPKTTVDATTGLDQMVATRLDRYRRMGHDVHVEAAHYVPLDIELTVCVKADYLRGHVKAALLEVFGNRSRLNGELGFFHPDRLTFGEGVYLSEIVATAQAIEGVDSVTVTRLQRLFESPNDEIKNGLLPLGPFEVAQVDNDPNYPEYGRFTLVMQGGR